jgi:hypothetical protein
VRTTLFCHFPEYYSESSKPSLAFLQMSVFQQTNKNSSPLELSNQGRLYFYNLLFLNIFISAIVAGARIELAASGVNENATLQRNPGELPAALPRNFKRDSTSFPASTVALAFTSYSKISCKTSNKHRTKLLLFYATT